MYWLLLLLAIVLLLWLCNVKIQRKRRPPGPIGVPFLGYLPFIDAEKPYETFTKLSNRYGDIFGLQLGSIYTVVLCDPNIIRDALKKEEFTGRAPLFVTHGIMGGYGLICAEGKMWKDHRKLTIEWLRKMGMQKFGTSRDELETRLMVQINDCIQGLERQSKQSFEVNPKHVLHHTLGNIMNDIVFGKTYSDCDDTWKYLQNLQEEGVKYIGVSGAVNFLPFLRFLPKNKNIIKFLLDGKQKTHKIYDDIIEKVQQTLDYDVTDGNDGKSKNIIKYFLKEKNRRVQLNDVTTGEYFCDKQFRHLLADLFGAGVDTTLTTIRWFIFYMAKNSDVQTKAFEELKSNCKEAPKLDDFINLPYMKACISETQRIRSVVPVGIPHGANCDTTFYGFEIPKDAMIMPLQWAIHMNPKNFPDPEQFDPMRFLDADGHFINAPSSFMPFQTGKRMCLGDELAKMILYLYCGHIIYNFHIELLAWKNYDTLGTCGITLTPPDYEIILKKRK